MKKKPADFFYSYFLYSFEDPFFNGCKNFYRNNSNWNMSKAQSKSRSQKKKFVSLRIIKIPMKIQWHEKDVSNRNEKGRPIERPVKDQCESVGVFLLLLSLSLVTLVQWHRFLVKCGHVRKKKKPSAFHASSSLSRPKLLLIRSISHSHIHIDVRKKRVTPSTFHHLYKMLLWMLLHLYYTHCIISIRIEWKKKKINAEQVPVQYEYTLFIFIMGSVFHP